MASATGRPTDLTPQKEKAAFLAGVGLFARLSGRELRDVARLAERVEVATGEFFTRRGERADHLYVIEAGLARVVAGGDGEEEIEPHLLSQGDVVGWSALVDPYLYTGHMVAATGSTVLRIPGPALLNLMREQPQLGLDVMSRVAALVRHRYSALLAHASGRAPDDCPTCP